MFHQSFLVYLIAVVAIHVTTSLSVHLQMYLPQMSHSLVLRGSDQTQSINDSEQLNIVSKLWKKLGTRKKKWTVKTNLGDLFVFERIDERSQLVNLELYRRSFLGSLPSLLRPKPLAKTGYRSYTTKKELMSEVLRSSFNLTATVDVFQMIPVAIFVYMWVDPSARGSGLGDSLLDLAMNEIRKKNLGEYMLLIHDDDGSGKLIEYYRRRGFIPIFRFLDKGMAIKL